MKIKNTFCIILSVILIISLSLTSFAWKSKSERDPVRESATGGTTSPGFLDKGLPAPIIKAPEAHAIAGEINLTVDGEYEYFYYKPVNDSGRILLPFRELFELFNMSVEWDDSSRKAIAKNDSKTIEITVNAEKAYVNGIEKTLDVPAKIIDNRLYMPVRFVAESLEYSVIWNDAKSTVEISTKIGGGN